MLIFQSLTKNGFGVVFLLCTQGAAWISNHPRKTLPGLGWTGRFWTDRARNIARVHRQSRRHYRRRLAQASASRGGASSWLKTSTTKTWKFPARTRPPLEKSRATMCALSVQVLMCMNPPADRRSKKLYQVKSRGCPKTTLLPFRFDSKTVQNRIRQHRQSPPAPQFKF